MNQTPTRHERLKAAKRLYAANYLQDKTCELCGEADGLTLVYVTPADQPSVYSLASQNAAWKVFRQAVREAQILCANDARRVELHV